MALCQSHLDPQLLRAAERLACPIGCCSSRPPQLATHTHDVTVDLAGSHDHELLQQSRHLSVPRIGFDVLGPDWGLSRGHTNDTVSFEILPGQPITHWWPVVVTSTMP